jgi:hypothetical protein
MTDDCIEQGSARRRFLQLAGLSAGAASLAVAAMHATPALAEAAGRSGKPLKAAFSNAGLQATWCAQGKQAAEYWGKLFNVEVTWFDGELSAVEAARGDRQYGVAEMGLRRDSGVWHRHADGAGEQA